MTSEEPALSRAKGLSMTNGGFQSGDQSATLLAAGVSVLISLASLFAGPGRTGSKPAAAARRPESLPAFNGGRAFEDLKRLVAFGPRPPGSKALGESRAWIASQLKAAGCSVEEDSFTALTPVGEVPMTNIIAKAAGAKPGIIMLAGHYDTLRRADIRFVGANDGGSSAAMLLEFARLYCLRKNPLNIWLVFFDGEEALVNWTAADSLYGSRHLAAKLASDGEIARIQGMILLDMVADKHLNIYKDTNSSRPQQRLDTARNSSTRRVPTGTTTSLSWMMAWQPWICWGTLGLLQHRLPSAPTGTPPKTRWTSAAPAA